MLVVEWLAPESGELCGSPDERLMLLLLYCSLVELSVSEDCGDLLWSVEQKRDCDIVELKLWGLFTTACDCWSWLLVGCCWGVLVACSESSRSTREAYRL